MGALLTGLTWLLSGFTVSTVVDKFTQEPVVSITNTGDNAAKADFYKMGFYAAVGAIGLYIAFKWSKK